MVNTYIETNAASVDDIVFYKYAYVNGQLLNGRLDIAGQAITAQPINYTNQIINLDNGIQTRSNLSGSKKLIITGGVTNIYQNIPNNVLAEAIGLYSYKLKNGTNILGIEGNVVESNTTNLDVIPSTSAQSITPNSPYTGFNIVNIPAITSNIDQNIQPENIKSGITILNIRGNLSGGASNTNVPIMKLRKIIYDAGTIYGDQNNGYDILQPNVTNLGGGYFLVVDKTNNTTKYVSESLGFTEMEYDENTGIISVSNLTSGYYTGDLQLNNNSVAINLYNSLSAQIVENLSEYSWVYNYVPGENASGVVLSANIIDPNIEVYSDLNVVNIDDSDIPRVARSSSILSNSFVYKDDGSFMFGSMRMHNNTTTVLNPYIQVNTNTVDINMKGVLAGYYESGQLLQLNNSGLASKIGLTNANLPVGISILNLDGTYTSDANAVATDITNGKTAYVNGQKIIGNRQMETLYYEHLMPGSGIHYESNQGFSTVDVFAEFDNNLEPYNIKDGVTIFGVQGSYKSPTNAGYNSFIFNNMQEYGDFVQNPNKYISIGDLGLIREQENISNLVNGIEYHSLYLNKNIPFSTSQFLSDVMFIDSINVRPQGVQYNVSNINIPPLDAYSGITTVVLPFTGINNYECRIEYMYDDFEREIIRQAAYIYDVDADEIITSVDDRTNRLYLPFKFRISYDFQSMGPQTWWYAGVKGCSGRLEYRGLWNGYDFTQGGLD